MVAFTVSVSQLPGPSAGESLHWSAPPPPPWPFDAMAAHHGRAALSAEAAEGKSLFDQKLGLCPCSEQLGDPQLIQDVSRDSRV